MTLTAYVSDVSPRAIRERGDILSGHSLASTYQPLTCRWPSDRHLYGAVVFCHGLGSDGGQYAALSRHWARHGYLVIHPTFADAISVVARNEPKLALDPSGDLSTWISMPAVKARMLDILLTPSNWLERIDRVRAVVDRLTEIVTATIGPSVAPLACAIAGHSFGAYTAQLLAGADIVLDDGPAARFRDPRFAAAVLLSAQGRDQQGLRDGSWDAMAGPVLTVTGTLDKGAKGGDWRWKSEPFELAPASDKYLMVLDDGDHHLGGFNDHANHRHVPAQQEAVAQVTLAFLDATLRDSPTARAWLGSVADSIAGCPVLFKRK